METKDYWFSLNPYIYVDFKKEKLLIYNTLNGEFLDVVNNYFISLLSQLYEPQNMGVILLEKELFKKAEINEFLQQLKDKQMCNFEVFEEETQKPIQFMPILNLQRDIEKLKKKGEESVLLGKDTLNYLFEVNIYLNNNCKQNCIGCSAYYKQISCCTSSNNNDELSIASINQILNQIKFSPVCKINILGGDISKYSNLKELCGLLEPFKELVHCYMHYKNYKKSELLDTFKSNIIISYPINKIELEHTFNLLNKEISSIHFIIENEDQYFETEKIVNDFDLEKYIIHPYFTGSNLCFFQQYIFLNKTDIFYKTQSIREIFRNQKLNSNFFGKIFIFSDGSVKANPNTEILGNIEKDSLLNLIYKELLENTAWRRTRDIKPCSDCVYQYLCPPLSNYETIIGRPDLCHIR